MVNLLFVELSLNTPALLFPAISLVMLAYSNRFLVLAARVRKLHDEYNANGQKSHIHAQIKNIRYRLKLIQYMQALGILTFLMCIIAMFFIYENYMEWAKFIFAVALVIFAVSLLISFLEIVHSTKAIEIELSDIEGLENPNVVDYLRKSFDFKDDKK